MLVSSSAMKIISRSSVPTSSIIPTVLKRISARDSAKWVSGNESEANTTAARPSPRITSLNIRASGSRTTMPCRKFPSAGSRKMAVAAANPPSNVAAVISVRDFGTETPRPRTARAVATRMVSGRRAISMGKFRI